MSRRGVPIILVLATALVGVFLVLDGTRGAGDDETPRASLSADQGGDDTPASPTIPSRTAVPPMRDVAPTGPVTGPERRIGPIEPAPPQRFVGRTAAARPLKSPAVPANPYLAPFSALGLHNDSYNTNSAAVVGPLGNKLQTTTQRYGNRLCSAIAFDRRDRLVGLCAGLASYTLTVIDPSSLEALGARRVSGRLPTVGDPYADTCGAPSFFLDRSDRAYTAAFDPAADPVIRETLVRDDGSLHSGRTYSLADAVPGDDCLQSMTLDWRGRIWFVSQHGTIGTLDRKTRRVKVRRVGGDEAVFTSLSADAQGSVYLVTTHALYRFEANRRGAPRTLWRVPYTRGSRVKPGQPALGSANPPTLVGKRWIAITDNASPRSRLVVLDRTSSTAPKPTCTVPLFAADRSAPASGLVAVGSSIVVGNNYGYTGALLGALGQVTGQVTGRGTAPGISRIAISARGCRTLWTSPLVSPSAIPKASVGSGLLYTYTKPARRKLVDSWYLTAVDLRSGKRAWSRLVGTGPQWDNHRSAVHLGPDGAAYLATGAGMLRLRDRR